MKKKLANFGTECQFGVCKAFETPAGTLRVVGVANAFKDASGNVFRDHDYESVNPFGINLNAFMKNPIVLGGHDKGKPFGTVKDLAIKEDGIHVVAEIYEALNPTLFKAVELGVVKTFSIGFIPDKYQYDEFNDTYLITESTLLELSVVSVPANYLSTFDVQKSADGKSFIAVKQFEDKVEDVAPVVKEVTDPVPPVETEPSDALNVVLERLSQLEQKLTPSEQTQPQVAEINFDLATQYLLSAAQDVNNLDAVLSFQETLNGSLNATVNQALAS